jgi:hypothetical protein
MNEIHKELADIEKHLGVTFPESYRKFLEEEGSGLIYGLPIYGLPASQNIDSVWGATEALRLARPDIPSNYVVIRFMDSRALCIDLINNGKDTLVEINLIGNEQPKKIHDSFALYLEEGKRSEDEINRALRRIENLFRYENIKEYDHKSDPESKSKRLPFKAKDWRVMRSSVHDQIVGLTAFRHNEKFNGLEVNVFISTDHPDYEPGHGVRALMMLLLSDAYKNGATMEIRFTRHDPKKGERVPDRIPKHLMTLLGENKIRLSRYEEGIITHNESVNLYASILGITNELKERIKKYEAEERLSLQGVCYIISSRLWTIEEATWILFNCPRPEGVLFGRDVPEDRMKYLESLSYGRAALAVTKFRNKLENNISENEGDSLLEVDGPLWKIVPKQPSEIDWSISSETVGIIPEEKITVLSRSSRVMPNENQLITEDVNTLISNTKDDSRKFILYSSDFSKVSNFKEIADRIKSKTDIEILLLPFNSKELDEEVNEKMSKARVLRT